MGKKRVLVGYGVDIDAVAGWLGSYGGEDSSSDISRGTPPHPVKYIPLNKTQACSPAQSVSDDSSSSSKRTP
jgi:hypothetical protein